MKRLVIALGILLAVIALAGLASAAVVRSRSDSGPMYSVGQLADAVPPGAGIFGDTTSGPNPADPLNHAP